MCAVKMMCRAETTYTWRWSVGSPPEDNELQHHRMAHTSNKPAAGAAGRFAHHAWRFPPCIAGGTMVQPISYLV